MHGGKHSIRPAISLTFLGLLILSQLALAAVAVLLQTTSIAAWIVAAISITLACTLLFDRLMHRHVRRLNELAQAISSLGKGDLSVRIAWAPPAASAADPEATARIARLALTFAGNFTQKFSLDPATLLTVGNIRTPALRCGQTTLNLETAIVDGFSDKTGGVATIFAKRGSDLVRIATSLKKPDGSRAAGTMLDGTGAVYQRLIKGEVFAGTAQLFGDIYMTHYEPLKSDRGEIIGALFVGEVLTTDTGSRDEVLTLASGINKVGADFGNFIAGLAKASDAVASAATALAASTEKVADGSRRQSEAAASTAAAVEQMTSSINQVADHAGATEANSIKTTDLSENGERIVQDASGEISRVAESVRNLSQDMASLGEHSREIGDIVQVIKKVAQQTNLLALNAAIEAARAGEQGRGFAVVADEVRKLAVHTDDATMTISGMIDKVRRQIDVSLVNMNESQAQVQTGVVLADRARDSLGKIRQEARHTLEMVMEISSATKEQSVASHEISRNIETIATMSDENTMVIANLADAAANLEQMSSNLQNLANRFRL